MTDIMPPAFADLEWRRNTAGVYEAGHTKPFYVFQLRCRPSLYEMGFSKRWETYQYVIRFDPTHPRASEAAAVIEGVAAEYADEIKDSKKRKRTWQ